MAVAFAAAGPDRALGAGWYQDKAAGVRFPMPFESGERKTAEQIRGLILANPGLAIPDGARYTSGLYAQAGVPYFLLWVVDEPKAPTIAGLEREGFDERSFDKLIDPGLTTTSPLKTRILVKALKDRTTYVGLFYESDADGVLLDRVRSGLEVEPGLALDPTVLDAGTPSLVATLLVGVLAGTASLFGYWLWRRRRLSRPVY